MLSDRRIRSLEIIEDGEKQFHAKGTQSDDATLCGMECSGDPDIGIGIAEPSWRRISCPQCVAIILYCKNSIAMTDVVKP